jgi:hypothetical protein
MAEKYNMADFLHKNSWFFVNGTAEWNVLILGYVILLALFYCKKFVARTENQNVVYIQDGVENVYIFHPIFSKIIFLPIFCPKIKLLMQNKTFFLKIQNDGII